MKTKIFNNDKTISIDISKSKIIIYIEYLVNKRKLMKIKENELIMEWYLGPVDKIKLVFN